MRGIEEFSFQWEKSVVSLRKEWRHPEEDCNQECPGTEPEEGWRDLGKGVRNRNLTRGRIAKHRSRDTGRETFGVMDTDS